MKKQLTSYVLFFALLSIVTSLNAGGKRLNPENPEDAVRIMRKVTATLEDGEPTLFWFYGSVFSHIVGEKDKLLFNFQGMNIRATKTVSNDKNGYGYAWVSREVLIYTDPKTDEIIHTWENPWTNETVDIIHIANDPVNSRFPIYANGSRGPFKLPAVIHDGHFLMKLSIPLFYQNALGGKFQKFVGGMYQAHEMFNWYARTDDLFDAEKSTADDVTIAWTRNAQWLPWMKMGSRLGETLYHGSGKRVASFDELPKVLKDAINSHYPKYKEPPPLDDSRPNETSWTYFKKILSGEEKYPWKNLKN
ncbi:MAG: DUF1838 family protein [Candidatus Marinimicrobia bacterium]|jgi:hypothetical protein|nr:DUF1838 family protein [Candidatus Neomarinimicrobiota bacterium]MBT3839795.1 DUF1838 family protein [Candidatus Neomarinimicrobiota bacterium]MBT3999560.1 DUF1838 family protein [Candidatus Neomarinimicrobiota bacterium]MBT4283385.1 DUF1838 family protein [Candidatus Neomarinimicrobiota bacterium]MBT4578920.1 DUF1838 family protein [Candidatus Neomarinimicrobiota bacterium]